MQTLTLRLDAMHAVKGFAPFHQEVKDRLV